MPTTDLDMLSARDCRTLLRTVTLGRLLFTENALPAIRPVTFTITDNQILMPSTAGSWAEKLHHVLVAFEADEINPDTHIGWSVLAHGTARHISTPRPALSMAIERISGLRLSLTPQPPPAG